MVKRLAQEQEAHTGNVASLTFVRSFGVDVSTEQEAAASGDLVGVVAISRCTCTPSLLRCLDMDAAKPGPSSVAKQFGVLDDFARNHSQSGGWILRGVYMAIDWTANSGSTGYN